MNIKIMGFILLISLNSFSGNKHCISSRTSDVQKIKITEKLESAIKAYNQDIKLYENYENFKKLYNQNFNQIIKLISAYYLGKIYYFGCNQINIDYKIAHQFFKEVYDNNVDSVLKSKASYYLYKIYSLGIEEFQDEELLMQYFIELPDEM